MIVLSTKGTPSRTHKCHCHHSEADNEGLHEGADICGFIGNTTEVPVDALFSTCAASTCIISN